jgi:hypothetical protein
MIKVADLEKIAALSRSWAQIMRLRPELLNGIRDYFEICKDDQDGESFNLRLLVAHLSKVFDDDPAQAERILRVMLKQGWLLPYALKDGDKVWIAGKETGPNDTVPCPFCGLNPD